MPAKVVVTKENVLAAVAAVRASGTQVTFQNGRVVGLAAIRQRCGGDAGRVRSMIIELLDFEGGRIPAVEPDQAARAPARLSATLPPQAANPTSLLELLLTKIVELLPSPGLAAPPDGTHPACITSSMRTTPKTLSDTEIVQKGDTSSRRPPGGLEVAARDGASQKAAHPPASALDLMRQHRAERQLPAQVRIDPFNFATLDQWAAAGDDSESESQSCPS